MNQDLTRPWNVFSLLSKDELDEKFPDGAGREALNQNIAVERLAVLNKTAAPGDVTPVVRKRLEQGLQRLADHESTSWDRPDAHVFASLKNCLTENSHGYEAGKVTVRRNEIGQQGLIGVPGFTTTPRAFHDFLASWVPEQGEKRNYKQMVAGALGAKDWEQVREGYKVQRQNDLARAADSHQAQREKIDVMADLRFGGNFLNVAIDGNRLRGGPNAARNIDTYSRMQSVHTEVMGVYRGLEEQGLVPAALAKAVSSEIRFTRAELKKPNGQEPLGDWAPPATAGLRAVKHAVEFLATEHAGDGSSQSETILRANQKMGLLAQAWEISKQPRDGRVSEILTRIAQIDHAAPVEGKPVNAGELRTMLTRADRAVTVSAGAAA